MSAKSGKGFLLKMGDGGGSETFAVIGGCRQVQRTMDADAIDVTSQDSSDWKELLSGAGVKGVKVSMSGVQVLNDAQKDAVRAVFLAGTIRNWQIYDTDEDETCTCKFKVVSFEEAGEYKGEMTYSLSLASSGAPVFS